MVELTATQWPICADGIAGDVGIAGESEQRSPHPVSFLPVDRLDRIGDSLEPASDRLLSDEPLRA